MLMRFSLSPSAPSPDSPETTLLPSGENAIDWTLWPVWSVSTVHATLPRTAWSFVFAAVVVGDVFVSPWVLGDAVLDEFGLWLLFVPWSTCFCNCSILAINHSRSRTECAGWGHVEQSDDITSPPPPNRHSLPAVGDRGFGGRWDPVVKKKLCAIFRKNWKYTSN